MKKLLPILLLGFVFIAQAGKVSAAKLQGVSDTLVTASVGEIHLSLAGYASPYASVILKTDLGMLRSGVADENGYFSISQVLIDKGFSHFCLIHIDFKRVGESETCMDIPPAYTDVTINGIFLPPTIGLYKKEITVGEDAVIFGYTMPNAEVILQLNSSETIRVRADGTGFYTYTKKDLKAGTYDIKATAELEGKESIKPLKGTTLTALSKGQAVRKITKGFFQRVWDYLTSTGIIFLLISFILLVIITYIVRKMHPEWFVWLHRREKKKKGLHHDWLYYSKEFKFDE